MMKIVLYNPVSISWFIKYVDMWHFSVPYNETNIYEATEKEWYANVMSKAAKNQLINGWGMEMSRERRKRRTPIT